MKRILAAMALLLMLVHQSHAQQLTIEECVNLAREHYPVVAQYHLLERVRDINLSNVGKAWLPQGKVSGQLTWQNDVAALPDVLTDFLVQKGLDYPGLDKTQYRVGIDVSQQIWDGGKTSANRRLVESGNAVEKASVDLQLYDLEARVEGIYFSILLVDSRIESAGKTIVLLDSTLNQVRSMHANGVAMSSDCDQIEAKSLTVRQQKAQLMAMRSSLSRVLELFIGRTIAGRTLVLPAEELSAPLAADHPQQRLFDDRIANITAQEATIKASTMPTFGAFVSGYYGYPGYNMFKNMQTRDLSFNFMAGVTVAWNFGSLYTRGNSLNKLQLQRNMVETERATFNFNNDLAMTESIGRIDALREVMRDDCRIVELRQSVVKAARSQLANGVIDTTALLSKITDSELALCEMAQHHIELVQAIYNLNHLRNK